MPPPVSLENLGNLAQMRKTRSRSRFLAPATATLTGVAAGALAWRLAPIAMKWRRRSSRRNLGIAAGLGLAVLSLARWQLQRLFTPQPRHEVEMRRGRLEVRRYPSVRIAETTVDASWDQALEQGFRRLASFIFGANDAHAHLPMTAPVIGTGDRGGFRLAFVLPEGIEAPTPEDPRVAVSDVPPRRVAVLRFNGRRDATSIESHKRELAHELAENGLRPRGEAFFAGYDPPSTLPLLRRNELWVELDDQASYRS